MSFYSYFSFVSKKLHLIKNCSFCFVDMYLCSNYLSTIALIYSLIILDFFPAFSSCNIFN